MIVRKLGAVGARTARACDGCLKTRARWYCSADDAFLCQACDTSVHSANQLARRHERIRLQTSSASFKQSPSPDVYNGDLANPPADNYDSTSVWYTGITRKARTPRGKNKPCGNNKNRVFSAGVVPHIGNDDENEEFDEGDEQLMCRVPVFDPFDDPIILCQNEIDDLVGNDFNIVLPRGLDDLSSEVDLAEFAAEVESMLETSDDKASGCANDVCPVVDGTEFVLDFESEGREEVKIECCDSLINEKEDGEEEKKMLLRLDYDAVLNACLIQGCNYPWRNGIPPQESDLDDDGWPNFLGKESTLSEILHCCPNSVVAHVRGFPRGDSEGREARVLRYKEKRRTRMFSKKIRYEVRKLNAEKRPRMKGRFVKRSTSLSFVQSLPLPCFRP